MILKSPWVWSSLVLGLGVGERVTNLRQLASWMRSSSRWRRFRRGRRSAEMLGVREVPRQFLSVNPVYSSDVEMILGKRISRSLPEGSVLLESVFEEPKEMGRK